jgi:hypothetical protein
MRALDALESSLFKDGHSSLREEIRAIDAGATGSDLSYPAAGRAVWDAPIQGYVLVWRDASKRWHFIDISDSPELAAEVNKPEYHTLDESFTHNVLEKVYGLAGAAGAAAAAGLSWLPWLIGGLVVLEVSRGLRR